MSQALVFAVGAALSPVAIIASILLLSSQGGTAKAGAFALGWLAGLAAVSGVLTVLVEHAGLSDGDPLWIALPETALGLAFVAAAVALWRRRDRRQGQPGWLLAIDGLTPTRSGGLGLMAAGANPKIVALALGTALALAEARTSAPESAAALGLFIGVGTLGVAFPLGIHAAARDRSDRLFGTMRDWLARHDRAVLAVVGLVLGAVFLLDGIGGR